MTVMIDTSTVSFDDIKQQLIDYVQSKPNYASWKDFYDSSAGTTIIELLAGFGTYTQFTVVSSRRETYLAHAEHRSSVAAVSGGLGYSMSRGANVHLLLDITPDTTRTVVKMDILGSYGDYDVVALDSYNFTSGEALIDVAVAIGRFKTEAITLESDDLTILRFISPSVSNDIRLLLNSTVLPLSSNLFDLVSDFYVAITNALGAVDVMYLNKGGYTFTVAGDFVTPIVSNPYTTSDILTLQYVELVEFTWDESSLVFDFGVVDNLSTALDSPYQVPELLNTARILAPLKHETNGVVKGRTDYKKLLQIEATKLDGDIVDTNAIDTSPAVVNLSYVKSDLTVLSAADKTTLLDTLDTYRPFGVEQNTITDPVQIDMDLDITITAAVTFASIGQAQLDSDIAAILANYEKNLGLLINLNLIEEAVEELSYVTIARVVVTNSAPLQADWNEYFIIDSTPIWT